MPRPSRVEHERYHLLSRGGIPLSKLGSHFSSRLSARSQGPTRSLRAHLALPLSSPSPAKEKHINKV